MVKFWDARNAGRLASAGCVIAASLLLMPAAQAQDAQSDGQDYNDNYNPQLVLPRRDEDTGSDVSPTLRLPEEEFSDPLLRNLRRLRAVSDRRRGQTVLERRRPDYDPAGISAGAFRVYPQATLRGTYTDNVFKQSNGRSDVIATLYGEILARSNWARHGLVLNASADQSLYAEYDDKNAFQYNLSGRGRLDATRNLALTFGLAHARDILDQGSIEEELVVSTPIVTYRNKADAAARFYSGNLSASVRADYTKRDYKDAEALDGSVLSQQYRDYEEYGLGGRLGYEIYPGWSMFGSVGYARREYRLTSVPNRDVNQWEFLGGLQSDITPLIRGQVGLGYVVGDFDDPAIAKRSGFAVDVQLDYLFSELTTFHLTARRTLTNTAAANSPGALVTAVAVGADHELLRNVILSGEFGYQYADYIESPRTTKSPTASLEARWLMNRHMRLRGGISWRKRDSNVATTVDYSSFQGNVGFTYLF